MTYNEWMMSKGRREWQSNGQTLDVTKHWRQGGAKPQQIWPKAATALRRQSVVEETLNLSLSFLTPDPINSTWHPLYAATSTLTLSDQY